MDIFEWYEYIGGDAVNIDECWSAPWSVPRRQLLDEVARLWARVTPRTPDGPSEPLDVIDLESAPGH